MTVTSASAGTLDEAYERLHVTGPEFDGFLSNHGPMAAEAMVRHGHSDLVGPWLDGYMRRLEEFPSGRGPIGPGWQEALGGPAPGRRLDRVLPRGARPAAVAGGTQCLVAAAAAGRGGRRHARGHPGRPCRPCPAGGRR